MTRTEFDALVRQVETASAGRPFLLRLRVAFWVLLGYAGILLLLSFVWIVGWAVVAGSFFRGDHNWGGLIIGGAFLTVGSVLALRRLWISTGAPEGVELAAGQGQVLRTELERLTADFNARPLHRILFTSECNACVIEKPRLGFLGWPRSYLVLGLPLMEELTPEEFRAVLAHEMAHLSKRHGRFSSWVYRMRITWERVVQDLNSGAASSGPRSRLLRVFLRWYWPRFNARAFVLSRQCEYEADAAAARWTSASDIVTGLLRVEMVQNLINGPVQQELLRAASLFPEPLESFNDLIRLERQRSENASDLQKWCREAFHIPTGNGDTHPSISDRTRAVGQQIPVQPGNISAVPVPSPAKPSSAEVFLGADLDAIRTAVDGNWRKGAASSWAARHTAVADHARQANLLKNSIIGEGSTERLCDEYRTTATLHGAKAAQPLLERILLQNPDHVFANLTLATLLIESGDFTRAETCLHRVLANPNTDPDAPGELLRGIYRRAGRADDLRALEARLDSEDHSREAAAKERSSVTASDSFKPHTLTIGELAPLLEIIRTEAQIIRFNLAEKVLQHRPSQRLFVLCLYGRGGILGFRAAAKAGESASRLASRLQLPGRLIVIAAGGPLGAIARKIARLPDTILRFDS